MYCILKRSQGVCDLYMKCSTKLSPTGRSNHWGDGIIMAMTLLRDGERSQEGMHLKGIWRPEPCLSVSMSRGKQFCLTMGPESTQLSDRPNPLEPQVTRNLYPLKLFLSGVCHTDRKVLTQRPKGKRQAQKQRTKGSRGFLALLQLTRSQWLLWTHCH